MSTRTIVETTCDECGEVGATSYAFDALGDSVTIDLCDTHVKPLADLVGKFADLGTVKRNGKRRTTRTPRRTPRSLDELAATEHVCDECGRTGFKSAAGLGAHRFRVHGIGGTSKATAS